MDTYKIDDNHEYRLNEKKLFYKGNPSPKSPEKAFKFYSFNLNNIGALIGNYFYLSKPSSFNDRFDCNINLISNISSEDQNALKTVERNSINNIGIASFTEDVDNHLLWAHYANNYDGFAIEFEGSKITIDSTDADRFHRISFQKVYYPEALKPIDSKLPFSLEYVLTMKMKHWEYEKEWRVICQLREKDSRILKYFPEKIKALYVGHSLIDKSLSNYKLLLDIVAQKYPELPVFVVKPHRTDLRLEFERVLN